MQLATKTTNYMKYDFKIICHLKKGVFFLLQTLLEFLTNYFKELMTFFYYTALINDANENILKVYLQIPNISQRSFYSFFLTYKISCF